MLLNCIAAITIELRFPHPPILGVKIARKLNLSDFSSIPDDVKIILKLIFNY